MEDSNEKIDKRLLLKFNNIQIFLKLKQIQQNHCKTKELCKEASSEKSENGLKLIFQNIMNDIL